MQLNRNTLHFCDSVVSLAAVLTKHNDHLTFVELVHVTYVNLCVTF